MNERTPMQDSEPKVTEEGADQGEQTEQPVQPTAEELAWQSRAERMGWAPKDKWRGPADKWVDAREFVERAESSNPVLAERYRALDAKFDQQGKALKEANTKISELSETMRALYEWSKKSDKRAQDDARKEILARQAAAAANADTATVAATTAELSALERGAADAERAPPPAPKAPEPPVTEEPPKPSPVVAAWINQQGWWFNTDEEMRTDAIGIYGALGVSRPTNTEQENLNLTLEKIKRMYPDKFTNQRRRDPPPVSEPNGGSGGGGGRKKFGYDDLPADAKKECTRFMRDIPGFKREDYVKEWVRQNGEAA